MRSYSVWQLLLPLLYSIKASSNNSCDSSSSSSSSSIKKYKLIFPNIQIIDNYNTNDNDGLMSNDTVITNLMDNFINKEKEVLRRYYSPTCWNDDVIQGCIVMDSVTSSYGVEVAVRMLVEKVPMTQQLDLDVTISAPVSSVEDSDALQLLMVDGTFSVMRYLGVDENNAVWNIVEENYGDALSIAVSDQQTLQTTLLGNSKIVGKRKLYQSSLYQVWEYRESLDSSPIKSLYYDGYLKARTDYAGYTHAEAFIHPAMVSHLSPSRVLLISSAPLQFIREILKHTSVEHVEIVGENLLSESKALSMVMPELNDCSSFISSSDKCLDDPRLVFINANYDDWYDEKLEEIGDKKEEIKSGHNNWSHIDDTLPIFEKVISEASRTIDRYVADLSKGTPYFDVVFIDVDMFDDESVDDFLDIELFLDLDIVLCNDSIIVVNSGFSPPKFVNPDVATYTEDAREFVHDLTREKDGFAEIVHIYDEKIAHPLPTTFIVMFLVPHSMGHARFMRSNPAAVDLDISQLLARPIDRQQAKATVNYEGLVHMKYTRTEKEWEDWYCSTMPGKELPICTTFLGNIYNPEYNYDKTEVRFIPEQGRSLFSVESVPKGGYMAVQDSVQSLFMDQTDWMALNKFIEENPSAKMYKDLRDFIVAYGYETETTSRVGWAVSISSTNTFTNHACSSEETNAGPANIYKNNNGEYTGFCPVSSRRPELVGILTEAFKDINAGDEIKMDYRDFRNDMSVNPYFEDFLINSVCGAGEGLVPKNEN